MPALTLQVEVATLPSGFCPSDYQGMANGFGEVMTVTFPSSFTGISVASTKPSDTTQAWLQLDSLGRPVRLYQFAQGAWLSQHPLPPGFTMIWTTALPDFTTFDGGDANGLGPASGAMWEVVTALAAKSPMGVGTLASGAAVDIGVASGEEKHLLTPAEGGQDPAHTHVTGRFVSASANDNAYFLEVTSDISGTGRRLTGAGSFNEADLNAQAGNYIGTSGVQTPATAVAHNVVHPVVGVYFLRRTVRQFYAVT